MSGETYESERKRALMRRSADLGLRRAPGRPVWGVVMEMGADDAVTTVVSTDDGAVSLLTSAGESLHLAKSDWPHDTGTRLIGSAGDFLFECSPAWAYPLPASGMVRFYLLTFDGVMTVETPFKELAAGTRPLSNLFYSAHDVYALARLVSREPDWRSYKPALRQATAPGGSRGVAPGTTRAEAPAAAAVVAAVEPPGEQAAPAKVPAPATLGSDLLVRAVAKNDVDEVALLLSQGHDHGPNAKGITPLMAAAHAGALEPLRLLLAAGAPVNVHDGHGYTALMLACNAGHDVCARLLLGAGAEVDARDAEGFTALMFAAKKGHDGIVRLLLERRADPAATNRRGLSAVDLATQKGHARTVATLLGG